MKRTTLSLLLIGLAMSAFAINWLLYPVVTAPQPNDTFMVGTLTTNQQIKASDIANWTYTNMTQRGRAGSASNAVVGSPLWLAQVDFTNKANASSNLMLVVSNLMRGLTNPATIVWKSDSTYTHVVINNNTVDQPPQTIGGSIVIASNLTANGYTFLTSNTAPRLAYSNVLVNGGTWVAPIIRGKLRVDMLFSNVVTFSLTNQNTTEFHLGGRTAGSGTNYGQLTIDTNPNDTIQGTNLSTGSGGTGLHGSKMISSFWSEGE